MRTHSRDLSVTPSREMIASKVESFSSQHRFLVISVIHLIIACLYARDIYKSSLFRSSYRYKCCIPPIAGRAEKHTLLVSACPKTHVRALLVAYEPYSGGYFRILEHHPKIKTESFFRNERSWVC